MGKTRKNSNYQTPKREAERLAREREIKREKTKKLILKIAIPVVALLVVTSIILGIVGANLGWFRAKDKPTHVATFIIKDYGTVEVELYGDEAPETVANFVKLAEAGYYNGSTFHRIQNNPLSILQGGDGDGTVDGISTSETTIKGEFKENGYNNRIKHERGVISMARTSDPNSASSQFFFVTQTTESNTKSLDGKYAAFGKVISGMGVLDAIAKLGNSDLLPSDKQPVILLVDIMTIDEYNDRENFD